MDLSFEYGHARVRELTIQATPHPVKRGRSIVETVEIAGEPLLPTDRFWRSFFTRFGVSEAMFKYFDHSEVFERISQRSRDDSVRYCVERDGKGAGRLLAVTNGKRPIVPYEDAMRLITRYQGDEVRYHDGVVRSTHAPRSGDCRFSMGGDEFHHRFVMDTPIDGFSQPKIHLSFLRLVCANGAVGYSRAFRSELSVGKDPTYSLVRALESYDNADGYSALRQRFESSQRSWASIRECHSLYKMLVRLRAEKALTSASVLPDFHRMSGNINELYGLANLDALSSKRQRVLPARCRVYDALNFASELATHHATQRGQRALQAWIGGVISEEFDMEGTAERMPAFSDFFVTGGRGSPSSLN